MQNLFSRYRILYILASAMLIFTYNVVNVAFYIAMKTNKTRIRESIKFTLISI